MEENLAYARSRGGTFSGLYFYSLLVVFPCLVEFGIAMVIMVNALAAQDATESIPFDGQCVLYRLECREISRTCSLYRSWA